VSPPRLSPEALQWAMEKDGAPLATKEAMLALLAETRATNYLARWTLFVAFLALCCSAVGIVLMLLG